MNRINLACLAFAASFGFLINAAGFNRYDVIHGMLLLQRIDPFLVMGSAVLTAMPLLWLLEWGRWRTPLGGSLQLRRWKVGREHVLGGTIFGIGWAICGSCPGPVIGMVAVGSLMGLAPFAGIFTGIILRDTVAERGTARHERSESMAAGNA